MKMSNTTELFKIKYVRVHLQQIIKYTQLQHDIILCRSRKQEFLHLPCTVHIQNRRTTGYIPFPRIAMCDQSMLLEYGLVGAFETVSSLRGEETAIIKKRDANYSLSEEFGDELEDKESVYSDNSGISYSELNFSSIALSCQMVHRFGIVNGDRVLLICGNNLAAEIVGMIACMRIGAIFVPIDDIWLLGSSKKIEDIIEDCSPVLAIVVAENDTNHRIAALSCVGFHKCAMILSDGTLTEWDGSVTEAAIDAMSSYDMHSKPDTIYILYTSGSTGQPKGVLGVHKGLVSRICWQYECYPWAMDEVACRRTPLIFVDSMAEIFSPLLAAIPIWCPDFTEIKSGGLCSVAAEANQNGVTRITLLPSQLHTACIMNKELGKIWPSLVFIFVSGEECHRSLIPLVNKVLPGVSLINLYGSTELSGDVSFAELCTPNSQLPISISESDKSLPVPIGYAIPGNYLFVVTYDESIDAYIEVCDGVVGELLVIGNHVAGGYFGNHISVDEKFRRIPSSKLRFITNTEVDSFEFAFMTGDLVSKVLNCFYYYGRKDRIVKFHGIRLDLDDIERSICNALGVGTGLSVVLFNNNVDGQFGQVLLLCVEFEVMRRNKFHSANQLRTYLQKSIFETYVPNFVIPVQSLPRTASNKLDRSTLKDMIEQLLVDTLKLKGQSMCTHTALNSMNKSALDQVHFDYAGRILQIYCDILPFMIFLLTENYDVSEIQCNLKDESNSVFDHMLELSFFELGGDSMSAVAALYRLKQLFASLNIQPPIDALALSINLLAKICCSAENPSALKKTWEVNGIEIPPDSSVHVDLLRGSKRKFKEIDGEIVRISMKLPEDVRIKSNIGFTSRRNFPFTSEDIVQSVESASSLCASLSVNWSHSLQKCVDSSCLIVSFKKKNYSTEISSKFDCQPFSVVYVGSHFGDFCAISAHDGEKLWHTYLGEHIESSAVCSEFDFELNATKTLLFIASYAANEKNDHAEYCRPQPRKDGTLGTVWCINAITGVIEWFVDTDGEVKGTPLIDKNLVIVGSHDGHIYFISCRTGLILLRLDVGGAVFAGLVSSSRHFLYAATTAGLLHTFKFQNLEKMDGHIQALAMWQFNAGAAIFSTPLIDSSQTVDRIIVCTTHGIIFCVENSFNEVVNSSPVATILWTSQITSSPIFSSPNIIIKKSEDAEDAFIVGSHDGFLRCLSVASGKLVWSVNLGAAIYSTPFSEVVFQNGAQCAVCIAATTAGKLFIVDACTGLKVHELSFRGEIYSSPVVSDKKIFFGCRDNCVYCVDIK